METRLSDPGQFTWPLATSLLFASSFVAAKITTSELQPLATTLLRYVVAVLFLSLLLIRRGPHVLRVARNDLWRLALLGLTGVVGYHYLFFLSLRFTEVANTAIINASSPVVTGVATAVVLRERLARLNYLGIAIACSGVLLLLTKGDLTQLLALNFNRGDLLMFCAILSWVGYTLLVKRLLTKYSGFTLTYFAAAFGVVILAPLAIGEGITGQLEKVSPATWGAVLYMGAGASGLGYLFYNFSIERLGPTRTSGLVYNFVPIFVATLAWIFFDEPVTRNMVLSAGLILAGLHLMHTKKGQCTE